MTMTRTLESPKPRNVERGQTEQLTVCPLCQSPDIRFWRQGRDRLYRLSPDVFVYSRCQDCRLIFLSIRPTESAVAHFYPEHYAPYVGTYASQMQTGPKRTAPFRFLRRWIQSLLKRTNGLIDRLWPDRFAERFQARYARRRDASVFLDFGCGSDKFLNRCRKEGWETTIGVDFSPTAIALVHAGGHQGYLVSEGAWEQIPDASVDFIRMNHVLEHLYEPHATLERLKTKLKPGGILHIALPNPDSLTARLFGERWFSLEAPRHIMHFSPSVLRRLLEAMGGFEVLDELHEASPKDMNRSLGYYLEEWGWISHAEVTSRMLQHPLLSRLFYGPLRLAAALRCGDRYHLFLRRR